MSRTAINHPIPAEHRHQLRPGVTFPDWAAVTSPAARKALLAILEATNAQSRLRGFSPAEDGVRAALLRHYAKQGRAPAIDELARRTDGSGSTVREILAHLAARDLDVLDGDRQRIIGAYPFTERDTDHRVRLGDQTVNAMCAIDALGAGDMYGRDVEIRSRCRTCGTPVEIATSKRGQALAQIKPATAIVWTGIREAQGCAASSLCTVIAFFCDDAHLEAWRARQDPEDTGFRLSIEEAMQIGRAIFAPSLRGLGADE